MSILLYNPLMDSLETRNNFRFSNRYLRPATDIYESDNEFIIKMDLPGIKRENISIEATFNELEIQSNYSQQSTEDVQSSEVQSSNDSNKESFRTEFKERSQRNFYRKFKFHKPINPQDAKVLLEDGVLTISLPLRPEAKKINLQIN